MACKLKQVYEGRISNKAGEGFFDDEGAAQYIRNASQIDISVGYLNIGGLLRFLSIANVTTPTRIIIGIESDKSSKTLGEQGDIKYAQIAEMVEKTVRKQLAHGDEKLDFIKGLRTLREMKTKGLIDIRASNNTEHSKDYILYNSDATYVITGSQNLTYEGICGVNDESSSVLGYIDKDDESCQKMLAGFEEKWANTHKLSLTESIFKAYDKATNVESIDTINELYIKALFEAKANGIEKREELDSIFKESGMLELEYQTGAVADCIVKIKKYNGVFLADDVGIGKTFTVLRILVQERMRAIIVAPAAIVGKWEELINKIKYFELGNNIIVVKSSYAALSKINDYKELEFNCIVIDEAHKFRNEGTIMYNKIAEICAFKHVILAGATPINNRLSDFASQAQLFIDPYNNYDFSENLSTYFKQLKRQTNTGKRTMDQDEFTAEQQRLGTEIREEFVSKIVVRRTRSDIRKYFPNDLAVENEHGRLNFPNVRKPEILKCKYSERLIANTIKNINNIEFSIYNKNLFLKVEKKTNLRDANLTNMLTTSLIKQLASSPSAFVSMLNNIMTKIKDEIDQLEKYGVILEIGIDASIMEDYGIAEYEGSVKSPIKYKIEDFVVKPNYLSIIKHELIKLKEIREKWIDSTGNTLYNDIKLIQLENVINNNSGHKIIVFTGSKVTADMVGEKLSKHHRVLVATGSSNTNKINSDIRSNFDQGAFLDGTAKDNYDILICTDKFSEGLDFNRSDIICQYDLPWNPTILIQRCGRLNRVNSPFKEIHVYNFFPCDEEDDILHYKSNIISKVVASDAAIGYDTNVIGGDIELMEGSLFDMIISGEEYKTDIGEYNKAEGIKFTQEALALFRDRVTVKKVARYSDKIKATVDSITDEDKNTIYAMYSSRDNFRYLQMSKSNEISPISEETFLSIAEKYRESKPLGIHKNIYEASIVFREYLRKYEEEQRIELSKAGIDFKSSVSKVLVRIKKEASEYPFEKDYFTSKMDRLGILLNNINNGLLTDTLCNKYRREFNSSIAKTGETSYRNAEQMLKVVPRKFLIEQANRKLEPYRCVAILSII